MTKPAAPYLTPERARSLACPSAPRACIGPDCAAWVAAPPAEWPAGSGRCLWHLRGQALGDLTSLTIAGLHMLSTAPAREKAVAAMAINMSTEATDQAEAPLMSMLARSEGGPTLLKAVLDGQPWVRTLTAWPELAAAGGRGAGRSPAGGVGNTPPAKCTGASNPPKSLGRDQANALTDVGSRYSPKAAQAFAKVLAPIGARIVTRHGRRRGVILKALDTIGGRRRVLVRFADGEEREQFTDAIRADDGRENRPTIAAVGARGKKGAP